MCDFDGGERSEVFTWSFRKARKEHRCDACNGVVKAGRRYGILFTVFEGTADSAKCCLPCYRAAQKFCDEHRFFPHPTGLTDALEECIDEEPSSGKRWRPVLRAIRRRAA